MVSMAKAESVPDTDLRSLPDPDALLLAEGIRSAKAGSSKTPQRAGEENSKLKRLVAELFWRSRF